VSASTDGEQGETQRFDQAEKQSVDYPARNANVEKCEIIRDRTLAGTSHCPQSDLHKDRPDTEPSQQRAQPKPFRPSGHPSTTSPITAAHISPPALDANTRP
jgi:hypothetical protein